MTAGEVLQKVASGDMALDDKVPGPDGARCLTEEERHLLIDILDNYDNHLDDTANSTVGPITSVVNEVRRKCMAIRGKFINAS